MSPVLGKVSNPPHQGKMMPESRQHAPEVARSDSAFEVERLRADFPILKLQVHGKPLKEFV